MPLALQLLFNLLGVLPLSSNIESGILVAQDLVKIGIVVDAWFKSPAGQEFVAHATALIKANGGVVTTDPVTKQITDVQMPYAGQHGRSQYIPVGG